MPDRVQFFSIIQTGWQIPKKLKAALLRATNRSVQKALTIKAALIADFFEPYFDSTGAAA